MYNANKPDPSDLPSNKQLLKSTRIAAVIASAVLVFAVLPAEYGVDPTGVGSALGLTEMGRIKMQLAEEAAADAAMVQALAAAVQPEAFQCLLHIARHSHTRRYTSRPVLSPEPDKTQSLVPKKYLE